MPAADSSAGERPLRRRMWSRVKEDGGQSTAEYGLLAVLVSIAAVLLLSVVGVDLKEMFDAVEDITGIGANGNEPIEVPRDDDASVAEARP